MIRKRDVYFHQSVRRKSLIFLRFMKNVLCLIAWTKCVLEIRAISYGGLATKWLRILSLDGNNEMRNYLVANRLRWIKLLSWKVSDIWRVSSGRSWRTGEILSFYLDVFYNHFSLRSTSKWKKDDVENLLVAWLETGSCDSMWLK